LTATVLGGCGRAADTSLAATDSLFEELEAKIEAAMARYHVPGAA
jgi:hypothetical protein